VVVVARAGVARFLRDRREASFTESNPLWKKTRSHQSLKLTLLTTTTTKVFREEDAVEAVAAAISDEETSTEDEVGADEPMTLVAVVVEASLEGMSTNLVVEEVVEVEASLEGMSANSVVEEVVEAEASLDGMQTNLVAVVAVEEEGSLEEGEDVVTWDGSAVVTLDVAMRDVREGEGRHLWTVQCHLLDIILAVRAHPVLRHHRGSNKNFSSSSSSSSVIRASAD